MNYDVWATEENGNPTRFEYIHDVPLKEGKSIFANRKLYVVQGVRPDESKQYDAVIEAAWLYGPPPAARQERRAGSST